MVLQIYRPRRNRQDPLKNKNTQARTLATPTQQSNSAVRTAAMASSIVPEITDVLMAKATVGTWRTISFTALAESPVQEAHRVSNWGFHPHIYDPSSHNKIRWRGALREALVDCRLTTVTQPFFSLQDGPLKCELDFYFVKRNNEVIPGRKDVDNMVKFILDAFEGPLYENDNAIVELTATKKFSTTNDAFVMVKVSMD